MFLIFLGCAAVLAATYFAPLAEGNGTLTDMAPLRHDSPLGIQDVSPENQSGPFDVSYDSYFKQASDTYGVAFALLKAHAIAESSLNPQASRTEPSGKISYGLLQILWWTGSDRFKKYGYSADAIGDGSILFDPYVNCTIAAQLIADNYKACKGSLRDTINMYNTGVKESKRQAPGGYVDKVLGYYNKILGV